MQNYALTTGSSKGIGLALAQILLKNNFRSFLLNSLSIKGEPIFFNNIRLIFIDLFFLSLSIKDKILFKSLILKKLFNVNFKLQL